MRPGEEHGRDYFFVSKAQFEEWIAAGALLEHAVVYGEYKGIPLQQVEEALGRGTDVVMRLDVQVGGALGHVCACACHMHACIAAESVRTTAAAAASRTAI